MIIGMLIFDDMTQLDFTGPYEVFAQMAGCEVRVIAKSREPVTAKGGLKFLPDTTIADAPQLDVLFVPGGPGVGALMEDRPVLEFLRRQAAGAKYVTSVCTGALVLGAAGLLKGYRATTHWLSLELLPLFGVSAATDRVVIDRNRITGGGVTAGIDFALVIAAQVLGAEAAKTIQLLIEYNPAPPFDSGHPGTADTAIVEGLRRERAPMQAKRLEQARRAAALYCGG
ncbi:MAG TPA: DJ-1/PfpI family protein [Burkholderiales bacterium]|nr:DJ-1/PfpI family protein [Burkholderiales bacterium]